MRAIIRNVFNDRTLLSSDDIERRDQVLSSNSVDECLRLLLECVLKSHPKYNLSRVAKRLGVSSTAVLNNYLKGRRTPSRKQAGRMLDVMGVSTIERAYLMALLGRSKALECDDDDLVSWFEREMSYTKSLATIRKLTATEFGRINTPLHFALREYFRIRSHSDLSALKMDMIAFHFSDESIERAVQDLCDVGLIQKTDNGYRSLCKAYEISDRLPNESIQSFHASSLQLALAALRELKADQRIYRSQVLPIRKKDLEKAKAALEDFAKRFTLDVECKEDEADTVVQLNVNLIPLMAQ